MAIKRRSGKTPFYIRLFSQVAALKRTEIRFIKEAAFFLHSEMRGCLRLSRKTKTTNGIIYVVKCFSVWLKKKKGRISPALLILRIMRGRKKA
jgi:hypothetical protein